jgi:hypothetical protein
MPTPPLPPAADDPVGGWTVEDATSLPAPEVEARTETEAPQPESLPARTPERQRHRRRPRRRERPPVERRLRPAGHALVIVVAALLFSLLLNAPGLHKSAHAQPDGWQRDVALAVTGPLESASGALLLDRPREAVKAVIGRADDDTIDTEIALPSATAANDRSGQPAPTPARRVFTKAKPMRLWVAGDSLVVVPGQSISRAAGASPVIEPVGGIDGRVATGLERPDVFNWFRYIPERMRELRPDVVVLGFGGNDDHGYMTGLPRGVEIDGFDTASWRKEYARRVGGLFDSITRAGAYVVWIGLPITRDAEQTRRFDAINAVVATEARRRPRKVTYLDTYTTFASDTGGYAQYLSDPSGRLLKVRAADGVHFEPTGGDMIAREVLRRLNRVFDLTAWRRKAAEA